MAGASLSDESVVSCPFFLTGKASPTGNFAATDKESHAAGNLGRLFGRRRGRLKPHGLGADLISGRFARQTCCRPGDAATCPIEPRRPWTYAVDRHAKPRLLPPADARRGPPSRRESTCPAVSDCRSPGCCWRRRRSPPLPTAALRSSKPFKGPKTRSSTFTVRSCSEEPTIRVCAARFREKSTGWEPAW